MINEAMFEPAHPLLPKELLVDDEQIPVYPWTIKKLSLYRLTKSMIARMIKEKKENKVAPLINGNATVTPNAMPIKYRKEYDDKKFNANLIYQCYRPSSIKDARDYFYFKSKYRKLIANYYETQITYKIK
jgi:hypothetical protein